MPATRAMAYLAVYKANGRKLGAKIATFNFPFNPKELTIQRQANWKFQDAKHPGPPEYNGTTPGSMTIEMFLDHAGESIKPRVDEIFSSVTPQEDSKKTKKPVAPYVSFGWGQNVYAVGVVKSVNAKYTRFDVEGVPIRALVTVTIDEVPLEAPGQNPTSGSRELFTSYVVNDGDTLASIAHSKLGAPNSWRSIAEANAIDDPVRLPSGRRLTIPIP